MVPSLRRETENPFAESKVHTYIIESGDIRMNIRTYKGTILRANIFLSLVLLVFSFASCSGQSRLMNLTPTQPAPPQAVTTVPGVQASYADLVARVAPAVV